MSASPSGSGSISKFVIGLTVGLVVGVVIGTVAVGPLLDSMSTPDFKGSSGTAATGHSASAPRDPLPQGATPAPGEIVPPAQPTQPPHGTPVTPAPTTPGAPTDPTKPVTPAPETPVTPAPGSGTATPK